MVVGRASYLIHSFIHLTNWLRTDREYRPCAWCWDKKDIHSPHHKGVPSPGGEKDMQINYCNTVKYNVISTVTEVCTS